MGPSSRFVTTGSSRVGPSGSQVRCGDSRAASRGSRRGTKGPGGDLGPISTHQECPQSHHEPPEVTTISTGTQRECPQCHVHPLGLRHPPGVTVDPPKATMSCPGPTKSHWELPRSTHQTPPGLTPVPRQTLSRPRLSVRGHSAPYGSLRFFAVLIRAFHWGPEAGRDMFGLLVTFCANAWRMCMAVEVDVLSRPVHNQGIGCKVPLSCVSLLDR